MSWAERTSQPFLIDIFSGQGNPCTATGGLVTIQDGTSVMSVFDASSPFGEIPVRLDRNVQITGAPFVVGDQALLTGRWTGQMCVATSLVKQ